MALGRPRYEGGEIAERDAFRLAEPEMSDEEYQACRAAWWKEFPCHGGGSCLCQGPPGRLPDGCASSSSSLILAIHPGC